MGIWPMAFLVTVIGSSGFIWLLIAERSRSQRLSQDKPAERALAEEEKIRRTSVINAKARDLSLPLLVSFLSALPLSAVVNVFVKRPLISWLVDLPGVLGQAMQPGSRDFLGFMVKLFLAPFTEEAVKLLPLAIPLVGRALLVSRGDVSREPGRAMTKGATSLGLAIGIGFGVGEALFLAWVIAKDPSVRSTPFYYFSGYFSERLIACFGHSVMTSFALFWFRMGSLKGFLGYLGAVFLHAVFNLGAALYQEGVIPLLSTSIFLIVSSILLILVFERLRDWELRFEKRAEHVEEVLWEKKESPRK